MKNLNQRVFVLIVTVWIVGRLAASAYAGYTPVSLSSVANEVDTRIQNQPSGDVTLGGIPFNILPNSANNAWNSDVGTTASQQSTETMTLATSIYGATDVCTLINTGWGVQGSNTVSISFLSASGLTYTKSLIEGTDIRDWLDNTSDPYSNTINGTTTLQVFDGVPNAAGGPDGRIDMQSIALPNGFADQTLTQITLTDTGVTGNDDSTYSHGVDAQALFILGVTIAVPEPPIFGVALMAALVLMAKRRKTLRN